MADAVKILHVEDNPDNRRLVRRILISAGYQVLDAVDGLEGIELAVREQPDLILLDINMPRFDGYEAVIFPHRAMPFPRLSVVIIPDDQQELTRELVLSQGIAYVHRVCSNARSVSARLSR